MLEVFEYVPLIVVALAAIVAAVTDAWHFRIYNSVTIPLMLTGIAFHTFTAGTTGLLHSLGGLTLGVLVLILPFVLGAFGAGDVKLMAGVGAWLGPSTTAVLFFIAAVVSAIYSVVLMVRYGTLVNMFTSLKVLSSQVSTMGRYLGAHEGVEIVARGEERRRRLVPFAVMIAVAAITVTVVLALN